MDARRTFILLLAATVPVSSALGLANAMAQDDAGLFADVWAANLWGDLVFTAGTVAATLAVARVMDRFRPGRGGAAFAAAVPVSFLLHWAVYVASWTLTGSHLGDGGRFLAFAPDGFGESWAFTFDWGWPGLLAMSFLSPALARWALARDDAARAAPATAAS